MVAELLCVAVLNIGMPNAEFACEQMEHVVNAAEDLDFEPEKFRQQSKSNRQASTDELINPIIYDETASKVIKVHHEASLYLYERLLEAGICREQARGVLPQNLYTEYYGTVNLNNLFKFIGLRLHEGAQWEIQQVAMAMLSIMRDLWPITIQSWIKNLEDPNLQKAFLTGQGSKI